MVDNFSDSALPIGSRPRAGGLSPQHATMLGANALGFFQQRITGQFKLLFRPGQRVFRSSSSGGSGASSAAHCRIQNG